TSRRRSASSSLVCAVANTEQTLHDFALSSELTDCAVTNTEHRTCCHSDRHHRAIRPGTPATIGIPSEFSHPFANLWEHPMPVEIDDAEHLVNERLEMLYDKLGPRTADDIELR